MKGIRIVGSLNINRAQLRAFIAHSPIHELHRIRPQMVEMGQKLLETQSYPSGKVVDRLAELFASQILAERN